MAGDISEVVAEQYDSELGGDVFSTYRLFDVNDDGLPELFIFGTNEAQGDQVYTVRSNGAVTQLAISQGDFMYDADRQLLWIPHGHMADTMTTFTVWKTARSSASIPAGMAQRAGLADDRLL